MRLFIFLGVLTILALLVDYYVYRRITKRHDFGRYFKIFYLVSAFMIDTVVIFALYLYRSSLDDENATTMHIVMWAIGLFFVNFVPKLVYSTISLGDYVVQRFRKGTSHYFGYTAVALGILTGVVMLWGMFPGRTNIRVSEVELTFANLPESFDGVTVVHFSDNHIGALTRRDRALTKMVERINVLNPDIVINSGDLVNTHAHELNESTMAILRQIKSRYGIYSVLGNHDIGIYIQDSVKFPVAKNMAQVVSRQQEMGWDVLVNRSVYVSNGEDSVVISGLNFPSGGNLNGHFTEFSGVDIKGTYRDIPDSLFNLTITHTPQLWDTLLEMGRGDLTVAGHVHSMQVKLHFGRYKWSPAKFMYDRWSGLYREGERYLYINDGMGYVMYPMRVGARPELTRYTLRSASVMAKK